jgi:hypothetical protein
VIVLQFALLGYRAFDRLLPINVRKEIEERNLAAALLIGLFLIGLVFGGLYFAAHAA